MAIYVYYCKSCNQPFDVIKSISRIEDDEFCKCGDLASRRISRANVIGGSHFDAAFNPAFGCVVKSKEHQREILREYKDKGREFEEVGNEPVENLHKHFDKIREDRQTERWNEPTEKIRYEALA